MAEPQVIPGDAGGLVYLLRAGDDPSVPPVIMLHGKGGDEKVMSISFMDSRCSGGMVCGTILYRSKEHERMWRDCGTSEPTSIFVRRTSGTNLGLSAHTVEILGSESFFL